MFSAKTEEVFGTTREKYLAGFLAGKFYDVTQKITPSSCTG
jgi:hypothetical protein